MTAMTLGELIEWMEEVPQDRVLRRGFADTHSNRGWYERLGVEVGENITVGDSLKVLKAANGKTFTGYKGGEFLMHASTEVMLSTYGEVGEELTGSLLEVILDDYERPGTTELVTALSDLLTVEFNHPSAAAALKALGWEMLPVVPPPPSWVAAELTARLK